MTLQAIRYKQGQLEIIDQLLLPHETKFVSVEDTQDGWNVIKNMQVRGAPAIGVVGCLSLAVELYHKTFSNMEEFVSHVNSKLEFLVTARPTAENMQDATNKLEALVKKASKQSGVSVEDVKKVIINACEAMIDNDIAANKKLGDFGAHDVLERLEGKSVSVLTHCNTGCLATAGYGTALGVIHSLNTLGKLKHCYCTETRPYNQGARLTAYELVHDKLPGTLICDSTVAMLMKEKELDAVLVGADRVVANGDTANKIGTYQIAIIAKYHNVLFYVVAPSTSVDLTKRNGKEIVIEERPLNELTYVNGVHIAPRGIKVWNPAFDVTPAELITGGIVTEYGVFKPDELEAKLTAALNGTR